MSDKCSLKFAEMQITEGKKQIKLVFAVIGKLDNETTFLSIRKKAIELLKEIN